MDSVLVLENYASSVEEGATTRLNNAQVSESKGRNSSTIYPDYINRAYQSNVVTRTNAAASPGKLNGNSQDTFILEPKYDDSFIYINVNVTAARGLWLFEAQSDDQFPNWDISKRYLDISTGTMVIDRLLGTIRHIDGNGVATHLVVDAVDLPLIKSNRFGVHIQFGANDSGVVITEVTRDGQGILPIGTTISILETSHMFSDGERPSISMEVSKPKKKSMVTKIWACDVTDEDHRLTLYHRGDDIDSRPYHDSNDPTHAQSQWILKPIDKDTFFTLRSMVNDTIEP